MRRSRQRRVFLFTWQNTSERRNLTMAKVQYRAEFSFTVHMEKDKVEQSFSCTHGEGPWQRRVFPACMAKDQVG
jgi:hypothetical protein